MKTLTSVTAAGNPYARYVRRQLWSVLLLGSLLSQMSCIESTKENPLPDGGARPEKGWVVGRIKDTQGNPMPNILVSVGHTLNGSAGMLGTSNVNGRYKVPLKTGSWRAYAYLEREYNGRTYKIDLHPDTYDAFDGDGAVRNFEWRLTGEKPFAPGTYYGGSVQLAFDPNGGHSDIHHVDVTFTPVGPLIDGTAGQPLTRRSTDDPLGKYASYITDVPIGRYRITARYRPTDKPLKVRNMDDLSQPYQDALTMDFFGKDSPRGCTNCMAIQFEAP
jgi:hypothetical protein